MKLRIRANSLRLRLTRSEVDQFGWTGRVEETIRLGPDPDQQITYALESSADAAELRVKYQNGQITVQVPQARAQEWVGTDLVGFDVNCPVGSDQTLAVLVEKDFRCLAERHGEDEADAYPHPKEGDLSHPKC